MSCGQEECLRTGCPEFKATGQIKILLYLLFITLLHKFLWNNSRFWAIAEPCLIVLICPVWRKSASAHRKWWRAVPKAASAWSGGPAQQQRWPPRQPAPAGRAVLGAEQRVSSAAGRCPYTPLPGIPSPPGPSHGAGFHPLHVRHYLLFWREFLRLTNDWYTQQPWLPLCSPLPCKHSHQQPPRLPATGAKG